MLAFENGYSIYNYEASPFPGIVFPAKSFLIKDAAKLVIISPANFDKKTIEQIRQIDQNPIFIAPNNFHHVNIPLMKLNFPNGQFYGPPRAARQCKIPLEHTSNLNLTELVPIFIQGHKLIQETCFFKPDAKILFVTDIAFNMNHRPNLPSKLLFKYAGTYKKIALSRFVRKTATDWPEFKADLKNLLQFPFETVIVSHGDPILRTQFEALVDQL